MPRLAIFLGTLGQDLRVAARMLRSTPALSVAIVMTLALAIGANTSVFTLVNGWLLTPLPVERPEDLVFLSRTGPDGASDDRFPLSEMLSIASPPAALAGLAATDFTRLSVVTGGEAQPAEGMLVSANLFEMLGLHAAAGRLLTPADESPQAPPVAVLSDAYWRRRFAMDRSIIGRTVDLDRLPVTIVGVLPRSFTGLTVGEARGDVWVPLALHPQLGLKDHTDATLIARLAPGVTVSAATSIVTAWYRGFATEVPGARGPAAARGDAEPAWRVTLTPAASGAAGVGASVSSQLALLAVSGALVLLVVCANLANLMLTRTVARRREIAVRLAVGATRGRVIRQLLTEGAVLALAGGALGIALAQWGGETLAHFLAGGSRNIVLDPTPDARILGFTLGLTIVSTLVFALLPALVVLGFDVQETLKSGARRSLGGRPVLRLGRALVTVQMALAVLLLVSTGVLARSVRNLGEIDPGYDSGHLLLLAVYPTTLGYDGVRELELYDRIRQRLETVPGVRSASLSRLLLATDRRQPCAPPASPGFMPANGLLPAGPRFFETMGLPLVAGREFDVSDSSSSPPVAAIGETAARTYFPGQDPIGRSIRVPGAAGDGMVRIVAVVKDVRTYSLRPSDAGAASCNFYVPVDQAPRELLGQMYFEVRTAGSPQSIEAAVRREIAGVDGHLSLFWMSAQEDYVRSLYGAPAAAAALAGGFSSLGLAFAAIGLFGVVSYAVSSRTGELGLRVALGAPPRSIRNGVLMETLRIALAGSALGIAGSFAATRYTAAFLYGVSPLDPVALGAATLTMVIVAVVAGYGPARRASRVDPAVALRAE